MLAQQQKLASMGPTLIANRPAMPLGTHTVRRVVHSAPNVHSVVTGVSPMKKDLMRHQEQQRKVVMPGRTQKPMQQIHHHTPVKPKAVINMPSLLGKCGFHLRDVIRKG